MSKSHELAYKDYIAGLKYKELAEKYGVTINTVKSWKTRYCWSKKVCTQIKKSVHTKKGAPQGNKNAVGNSGGAAPQGNKNAFTHGLYAKYLPQETLAIAHELESKTHLDILWENICIKYSAIIRSQKIMYVDENKGIESADLQANFLNAQSRAMATLNVMIKQYEELCRAGQSSEEQSLRIEKLKVDIADKKGKTSENSNDMQKLVETLKQCRVNHD